MNSGKKRIFILIAAMSMQLVLGVIYIWGVFQPHVVSHFGWDTSTASLTFSIVLAFFVVGGIVGGRFQDKYSPKVVVLTSGVMIGIGTFLASFTPASNPYFLYATYGILAGSGIGAIYTTTIVTAQKWFPDKKGLAGGLVVSALGFGGVVFTPVANYLLPTMGVANTFKIFAVVFTIICLIGGMFMAVPPKDYAPKGYVKPASLSAKKQYTSTEMLKTPIFYVLATTMLLSLPAFFMISPLIKVIGVERGMSDTFATMVVMVSSILNSSGRFIAPVIAEKIGNKQTIVVLNIVTIVCCICLTFSNAVFTMVLIAIIAMSFGGFLGIFPAMSSGFFGSKNAGANYGLVMTGYGLAAIFAPNIYQISLSFSPVAPFIAVAVLSVVAACVAFLIKAPTDKEKTPVGTAQPSAATTK